VVTANNGPARLLRNENGNQNDMLRVKLVGTRSNRAGLTLYPVPSHRLALVHFRLLARSRLYPTCPAFFGEWLVSHHAGLLAG